MPPSRMDGYLRVSRRMGREGPGYISPDVQRDAIQRWADYRDVEIVAWHLDEDESGSTQDRPGLREAMARVEAGETDGIACWRLNRFARNVPGAIGDVKRVQAAGGVLAFVEEDIDPTGPFGEFVLTVLLAVATLERENLVAGWKTTKERAIDRGVKIGPTPYGYLRREEDGILEPDPVRAAIVAEAFRRAAEKGFESGLRYITDNGEGHRWTATTFRRLLRARSYLGEAHYGELVKLDAHKPLVDRSTWTAAQPRKEKGRRPNAAFPLSGLARCSSCGAHLVGSRAGKGGKRVYRCSTAAYVHKGGRCEAPVLITADLAEAAVVDAVKTALAGMKGTASIADGLDEARREYEEAERALEGAVSLLTGLEDVPTTREKLAELREARDRKLERLQDLTAATRPAVSISADDWDVLTDQEQRDLIRAVVSEAVVSPGRGPERIDVQVRYVE